MPKFNEASTFSSSSYSNVVVLKIEKVRWKDCAFLQDAKKRLIYWIFMELDRFV